MRAKLTCLQPNQQVAVHHLVCKRTGSVLPSSAQIFKTSSPLLFSIGPAIVTCGTKRGVLCLSAISLMITCS